MRYTGFDPNGIARVFSEHDNADVAESGCKAEATLYVARRRDTGPLAAWTFTHNEKARAGNRPMTKTQFCTTISKVGLTQESAGVFFGRSERTGQRWATGEYTVPDYVAKFLRLMIRLKLTPDDVK